jgi:hypothetical protein
VCSATSITDAGTKWQPLVLSVLFWNGSEEEGRAHFKPFFDLGEQCPMGTWASWGLNEILQLETGPVMDTCKEIPYEELNSIQVSTPFDQSDIVESLSV